MNQLPAALREEPALAGARIVAGPTRHGNELRWELGLGDGRAAQLARLVDELAADESVRRRYRRDVRRLAELALDGVAPILAWGPHDDADSDADSGPAPWRLRLAIEGQSLEAWLEARAPAPPDEVGEKLIALCRRLALLHARGLVIRDLSPAKVVYDGEGRAWLADIGLARTDILSTRTAASLVLEGSPYAAPELLMRTAIDGRADLYAVGVMGFRALTGALPFGDVHALLRPSDSAPAPSSIRPGVPAVLDELIVSLLEVDPGARPETAALVADVLGGDARMPSRALARADCQSCGAPLPVGQRLCLSCGKLAVVFEHAKPGLELGARRKLVLRKAKEEGEFMSNLRQLCGELCEGEVPALNFVLGDARMYSKAEQERMLRLPVTLYNDLDADTATALQQRFAERGVPVDVQALDTTDGDRGAGGLTRTQRRSLAIVSGLGLAITIATLVLAPIWAIGVGLLAMFGLVAALMVVGFRKTNKRRFERWGRSLMKLRSGPAALPASDPLVARLAALVQGELAPDVHELVSRLALLVQRMVDHRAENLHEAGEIELAVSALDPLVGQIEARVAATASLDRDLASLDEGRLVRALASARARGDEASERTRLLDGLDRLRELEVERARALAGLNEACDLARRSVELGLRVKDPEAEHARNVELAMRALGTGPSADATR